MRILIIDDEVNIRHTTAAVLESMDHEPSEASDTATARKILEKQRFDVIFLDLRLGNENGLDLMKEILQIEPDSTVIVSTAFASLETAVEAIKAGAYDYIPKPFTPEQLRQVLKKAEQTRHLQGKVSELESRLSQESPLTDFTTVEPVMQKVYEIASKTAATQATILILG
jgi:two-component system, NtrC family, response regulator AlgB